MTVAGREETGMETAGQTNGSGRAGLYIALLQLFFTLGWTVYVIYLPQLAAKVGLPAASIVIILLIDQAVFTVTDTLMGVAADRMTRIAGRLSHFVIWLTVISCAAFLAMPFVADTGPSAQTALLVLIGIWAATSSALRAPPLALLGKYAAKPSIPVLSCLAMLGYGLAGAVSPYLGVALREIDPRIPFAMSSIVLLFTALAISWIERQLRNDNLKPAVRAPISLRNYSTLALLFIATMLILAVGYQMHFNINSAPLFLRFAKQPDLQWLMPVYWIGFNVAMLPAPFITRRLGGLLMIGCAGLLGAAAIFGAENAASLNSMLVMQFIAGAAWGCILASAVATATAIGGQGSEGKILGLLFSAIALATFTRIAAVSAGVAQDPTYEAFLHWTPIACWLLAGAALSFVAVTRLRQWRNEGGVEAAV